MLDQPDNHILRNTVHLMPLMARCACQGLCDPLVWGASTPMLAPREPFQDAIILTLEVDPKACVDEPPPKVIEPLRVCRRMFCLSHAAIADVNRAGFAGGSNS
jgi:hypothetical protein